MKPTKLVTAPPSIRVGLFEIPISSPHPVPQNRHGALFHAIPGTAAGPACAMPSLPRVSRAAATVAAPEGSAPLPPPEPQPQS